MSFRFEFKLDMNTPKYLQIVSIIEKAIREKNLKKGDLILSINEMSDEYLISRDTVQKAYNILKGKKIIDSVRGKGYYVKRTDVDCKLRILLIFNKISNYKKQIYDSFVEKIGNDVTVDFKLHHCDLAIFSTIIDDYLNEYDYFVVMPHFYDDYNHVLNVFRRIPAKKLVILDKELANFNVKIPSVFQDFKNDIYDALEKGLELIQRYKKIMLVFPTITPYPKEIQIGFRSFCCNNSLKFEIINEIKTSTLIEKATAYVLIEETDIVNLIKLAQLNNYIIGKDIGIISYNETPLKEILLNGITVISTNFKLMGETTAELILNNKKEKIKNPFSLILRNSL